MSRSLKKGPFADSHLLNKVETQNKNKSKKLFKLDLVVQQFSHNLLDIHSVYIMAKHIYLYM